MRWQSACRELEVHYDFVHYIELFGLAKAERLYKQHITRLRDDFVGQQQSMYLHRLDAVLHKLLPDLAAVADRFVVNMLAYMHTHTRTDTHWFSSHLAGESGLASCSRRVGTLNEV